MREGGRQRERERGAKFKMCQRYRNTKTKKGREVEVCERRNERMREKQRRGGRDREGEKRESDIQINRETPWNNGRF